jgi:hypothetical protein
MSALIWQCVRDNHAYLKKGHGPKTLSAEVANLTGLHNGKYSGLACKRVAGMNIVKKGKKSQICMSLRNDSSKATCPNKAINSVVVSKSAKKAANCITKNLQVYRPDLVSVATTKYQKIKRTFRARK